MKSSAKSTPSHRKPKLFPRTAWVLAHSPDYLSCIVEYDEEKVRKAIRCAKACKEPKPKYIKVRITEAK